MINVRGLANQTIQTVNPNMEAVLFISDGYEVDDDFNQVPKFTPYSIQIQPQSLSSQEKDHLDLVNRQGEFISVYAYGDINAIRRVKDDGSSKLEFAAYGESETSEWNVQVVLESYATWVRLLLWRQ